MYYKLKIKNEVVDAVADPMWLRSQRRGGPVVTFDRDEAEGVVASDGSESFNLFGHVLDEAWKTVEAIEIAPEEYDDLVERLKEGPEEEELPEPEGAGTGETVAARADLADRVGKLEKRVEEQGEMNELLKAAVLEMSEEVYA